MYPNELGPENVSKSKSWVLGMYRNQGVGHRECIQINELGRTCTEINALAEGIAKPVHTSE